MLGLIALAVPRTFERIAVFLGTWVETRPTVEFFDWYVDIDRYVLRHARAFGGLVVLATILGAMTFVQTLML